eukprot:Amastigsp_a841360_219.p4 type:complete len:111 gc:universal Amastigsp_a841360_219:977-1309(+)
MFSTASRLRRQRAETFMSSRTSSRSGTASSTPTCSTLCRRPRLTRASLRRSACKCSSRSSSRTSRSCTGCSLSSPTWPSTKRPTRWAHAISRSPSHPISLRRRAPIRSRL